MPSSATSRRSPTPTKKRPKPAYVWSEDWRVPVQDGQLGEPEIVGEYRIKNFLRKDDRLNCSGGKTPSERCTGVSVPPPDQSGIPGGGPAAHRWPAGGPDQPLTRPAIDSTASAAREAGLPEPNIIQRQCRSVAPYQYLYSSSPTIRS